ncbi:hypothetical protein EJB05_20869, partial [Eragrostis curvula]
MPAPRAQRPRALETVAVSIGDLTRALDDRWIRGVPFRFDPVFANRRMGDWPLTQSTRFERMNMLAMNMSSQTSARGSYGILGKKEAHENAKRIEMTCFEMADAHFKKHGGDGTSAIGLYASESVKMMLQVMKETPRTRYRDVVEADLDDMIEFGPFPSLAAKHGPGHKRSYTHDDPDEAEDLASSSLTNSRSSCKRICFKDMSFGIGDANVDAGRDLKPDVSTNTHMRVGAGCSTQWIMEKLEYVLTKINGNFISNEVVDRVKKILEAVRLTDEKESDVKTEDVDQERVEDDNGGLDSKH